MNWLSYILLCGLFSGCAASPQSFVRALTPETMTVSVTAPNAIESPERRNNLDQVGLTVGFTYRLKPLRIQRDAVQPVQIVRPPSSSAPTPSSTPAYDDHRSN